MQGIQMLQQKSLSQLALSMLLLVLFWDPCSAQNWALERQSIQPVPQYSPRYPLHEEPAPVTPDQAVEATQTPPPQGRQIAPLLPAPQTPKHATNQIQPHYGIDYSIYRDTAIHPIDPRKPCVTCVRPEICSKCGGARLGNGGRPYVATEPGGCVCGKKNPTKHPQFSVHWPRPFSARIDERNPERADQRYLSCQPKRKVDLFDHLQNFKLVNYTRTDNGYCGKGADPYGCLGESKQRSSVAGLGYRHPSVPFDQGRENSGRFDRNMGW